GGTGIFIHQPDGAKKMITKLIHPDFKVLSGDVVPGIMHRKIGNRDLYFVYGLPKNTTCFFRATGKAELWNPWNGTTQSLKVTSVSETGTTLQLPLEQTEPQLIVFSPGKAEISEPTTVSVGKEILNFSDTWEFEIKPTLDNQYGDYRLPAFTGKIGVEVWRMKFAEENLLPQNWQDPNFNDSLWPSISVSYGPQFFRLGPLAASADSSALEAKLAAMGEVDVSQPVEIDGKKYTWQPYEFSWRWGLKDDAGHQGYHGLKGQVNDELISLGSIDKSRKHMPVYSLKPEAKGSVYYLWSTVLSPGQIRANIYQSGLLPSKVYVNNFLVKRGAGTVELNKGYNPLLLKYTTIGRGYFVLANGLTAELPKKGDCLSTSWYLNPNILPFASSVLTTNPFGWYRFKSPPGLRAIFITTRTKPEVWIEGEEIACIPGQLENGRIADLNLVTWKIVLPELLPNSSTVAIRLEQFPGFFGGAAIPEPIVIDCGKGNIQLGDLAKDESLKTYSGGMWYRNEITLNDDQANSGKILLNLGNVVASAEVLVNGKFAGAKVSAPYTYDLTGKLNPGENKIEILVYNTLGNHFLTTPSQYVGRTISGLIGPVTFEFK
ncbi:MAG TPA: hypothetical protein VN249_00585, partial [Prolixibacteraceae bacterium]|nr:hypothetical protein [Prolixibacteraceae bacterium]